MGSIDGKHIRIVHPLNLMHINYKGYSSIFLMGVADAEYRFAYANVVAYGKDCDFNIFLNCELWRSIIYGILDLPEDKCPSRNRNTDTAAPASAPCGNYGYLLSSGQTTRWSQGNSIGVKGVLQDHTYEEGNKRNHPLKRKATIYLLYVLHFLKVLRLKRLL